MTQVPTPGPLSTEHEFNPDLSMAGEGYCMVCGRHQDDHAPTAPVEASGSERWAWVDLSCEDQMKLATKIAANVGYVLTSEPDHPDSPHNRPQPSGETQNAEAKRSRADFLDSKCPDDEWAGLEAQVLRDEAAQDEGAAGELAHMGDPCVRCGIEHDKVPVGPCEGLDAAIRKVTEMSKWEREGHASILCAPLRIVLDAAAHPSPTPAADADRVREAIADVISHENDWRTALTAMDAAEETPEDGSGKPGYWLHQIKVLDRILAALKSEGK